ncbi:MAG TPA: TonB family protein [Bryobacteraceae bacterium]|nr:TonB family protein [Bryobacteraceae bacterium]
MRKTLLLLVLAATGAFADRLADARQAMQRGELVNAEQILNVALDAAQNSNKPKALDAPLDLLAQVYRREKRYPEAFAAEQRRIRLWSGLYGENAVIVGRILGQLSAVEKQAGTLADAEMHARRALAILTAAFPDKPAAAQAAIDLADVLIAGDRGAEAEQMLAVAQKMYEASVGPQSMLTAGVAARRATLLQQPAPAAQTGGIYKIGGPVSAPSILSKTEPTYPEEARQAKLQGTISLSVVIDATGAPTQIAVLRPLGMGLDEAAVQAVSQWKFAPGMKNGVAVPVYAQIEVTFHLL